MDFQRYNLFIRIFEKINPNHSAWAPKLVHLKDYMGGVIFRTLRKPIPPLSTPSPGVPLIFANIGETSIGDVKRTSKNLSMIQNS